MELYERRVSGQTVFTGRVFNVELDEVELPGGKRVPRELVRHNGGVAVLALDEQERVILVRQYRYGAGRVMLEIPAGKLEPGEEPLMAGLRELREETGYTAAEIRSLGNIVPTGAYDSEIIHLYLARGLTEGESRPDEDEFVEMVTLPLEEAVRQCLNGKINDAKTVAALLRYRVGRDTVLRNGEYE